MKASKFTVVYIGDNPPNLKQIQDALWAGQIDDGGTVEVTQEKIELCDACGGTGNVDEGAGFTCDCVACVGTGWIE